MVTNVREMLSVDLIAQGGIVVRYRADDGRECFLGLSGREAHALADMIAIALSRAGGCAAPDGRPLF